MQCLVWHKDQTAVCHVCLIAVPNAAMAQNADTSSEASAGHMDK